VTPSALCCSNSKSHRNQDDSRRSRATVRKITGIVIRRARTSLHSCLFPRCSMLRSRKLLVCRSFCFQANRRDGSWRRRDDDQETQRCHLTACSQDRAESSLHFSCLIIDSVRATHPALFMPIDETELDSSRSRSSSSSSSSMLLTRYDPRGVRVFCFHGKASWTRTSIIAATASICERITGLHEGSVDGSK
jgi:hypothetical protein